MQHIFSTWNIAANNSSAMARLLPSNMHAQVIFSGRWLCSLVGLGPRQASVLLTPSSSQGQRSSAEEATERGSGAAPSRLAHAPKILPAMSQQQAGTMHSSPLIGLGHLELHSCNWRASLPHDPAHA